MGNEFSGNYEDSVNFTHDRRNASKPPSRPSKKSNQANDERLEKYYDQMKVTGKSGNASRNSDKPIDKANPANERKAVKGLDMIDMAGMMAYVKEVAKHSGDLPLTRRDDPELGRTVSSLTSHEYAIKAAAFIPPDVRMIAGTSLDYAGHNWDLPKAQVCYLVTLFSLLFLLPY